VAAFIVQAIEEIKALIYEILDGSWIPVHFDEEPKKCVIGHGSYKFRCLTQTIISLICPAT